jgi:hypothetical protein
LLLLLLLLGHENLTPTVPRLNVFSLHRALSVRHLLLVIQRADGEWHKKTASLEEEENKISDFSRN